MTTININRTIAKVAGKVPLRIFLIVPFVLQIVGAVGLVGYLSFKNGQQAVEKLADQLIDKVGVQVEQNLQNYLDIPQKINENQAAAIRTGILNWQDFSALERYFAQQLKIYPTASSIAIATEKKEFLDVERLLKTNSLVIRIQNQSTNNTFHYYTADFQGKRLKLTKIRKDFDPHNDSSNGKPWYGAAKQANRSIWRLVVGLSQGVDQPVLMIVNFLPFNNRNGSFQGVLASTVFLPQFTSFLESLKIGQTGQTFIIDRQGLLIASSTGEIPFKQNLNANYRRNLNPQEWRLAACNSKNTLTQKSVIFLLSKAKNLNQIKQKEKFAFDFRRNRYFLRVTPIQNKSGLDLLVITVVPESDFMAQINANTRTTILLCLTALFSSIGIGLVTTRWIIKPILGLNTAAKDIAKGEWDKTVEVNRSDEIGALAKSFNKMAEQLQASFAALKDSENRLNQFLEALPVGVSIQDATGKVSYLNQKAKQLLNADVYPDSVEQIAEVYQIYQSGTDQLYPTEKMPEKLALQGETLKIEDLEIHRNEQIIPLEVYSSPIFDEAGNVIYAITAFTNITERRKTQNILNDYDETLEHQVIKRTTELIVINKQLEQEIIDRKQLEEELRDNILREKAIIHILQRMRQTLNIDTIFNTTTAELRQVINCDRVVIYRFNADWSGQFVAESVAQGWIPFITPQSSEFSLKNNIVKSENCVIKNLKDSDLVQDTYLQEAQGSIYSKGVKYRAVEDIYKANFTDCYLNLLKKFQAKAYIIVPIFCNGKLWGLLATYQNSHPRSWNESEITVVDQIGTQMGIAVQQAQLLEATQQQAIALKNALEELKYTQTQLIQAEKMSSLGQMVAGIAHEINNPVSFIQGNLTPANQYLQDVLSLIELYQQTYPDPTAEIKELIEEIDLDFLVKDWSKLMDSMLMGTQRIRDIILSLRNFSRLDEKVLKPVDIHEGIENTLLILQHRLRVKGHRPEIEVIKNYGQLPLITCYASQLNQVFMNILNNAIDALGNQPEPLKITISTSLINQKAASHISQFVVIKIADNGSGMTEDVQQQIFDPFFTTKPVGSGTGLGLSISYQIVTDRHQGKISCSSTLEQGTEFIVEIPVTCQVS